RQAGFPIIVLELPQPLVVRRRVALATAVLEGEVTIEGLPGRLVSTPAEALRLAYAGVIPVLVAPQLPVANYQLPITILIDARMAKRNLDTRIDQAALVIGLGPGFEAGRDCHAVIETMRGHRLGRVIWQGSALPNTGTPGLVAGKGAERVLRAPLEGVMDWRVEIGDRVKEGDLLGTVDGRPVVAPFDGVLRGLIAPGTAVPAGLKIGDLDPRGDVDACFTLSDKALAVGGGVLEVVASGKWQVASGRSFLLPATCHLPPPTLSFPAALGLTSPQLVAIAGAGGKTTLLLALGRSLPGRVVMTTTTRLAVQELDLAPAVVLLTAETPRARRKEDGRGREKENEIGVELERYGSCLVMDGLEGDKAVGVPMDAPGRLLARPDVDFVVVEADGSRGRPCKAPAAHEPVIPVEAGLVVYVAGIDAVGGRLAEVAHRPEQIGQLTGLALDDTMTPAALAALIIHPQGGLKNVPPSARFIPFLNKVDSDEQLQVARQVARQLLREPRVQQVVIGAVQTVRPVREIHRRVTAVVLAAGQSARMGQTKQLLPWGDTTILGRTLRNLAASAIYDVWAISGHDAEAVEAEAAAHGVNTLRNTHYVEGEMLSSLQLAVQRLPTDRAAVLVTLADQPMVGPATIDQLLVAYWQGYGELLAPSYQGQRGNPVLIGRPYFDELLALPPGAAPRDLLQKHRTHLRLVEVNSDSILCDLDRPEEYERWRPKP
ncbi:MAG: selenium-dependent molybdenum cofactor biosynthesis protein YqeB, partial [Chloroflexota bacterium]